MEHLLEIEHLSVYFPTYAGDVQAVRDVSFTLEKGETLAIVGESGCGKSVTAKAVMGLIEQTAGKVLPESMIRFDGKNILEYNAKEWQAYRGANCGIVFQDALTSLNPTMKIGKQIQENITNHKKENPAEAKAEVIQL